LVERETERKIWAQHESMEMPLQTAIEVQTLDAGIAADGSIAADGVGADGSIGEDGIISVVRSVGLLFARSFVGSFVGSFARSFVRSLLPLFVRSLVRSFGIVGADGVGADGFVGEGDELVQMALVLRE
jgi:hypothetical protein